MSRMFYNCQSLKYLDLSALDTSETLNMDYAFYNCTSLEKLEISQFETRNAKDIKSMFNDCSSLKSLVLTNFETLGMSDDGLSSVFDGCTNLILNIYKNKCSNLIIPEYVIVNDIM